MALGNLLENYGMTCPDCETEMRVIKLIDRMGDDGHAEIGYAAGDAERGWFFGRYPEKGQVSAKMCPTCGRIILHGSTS